MNDDDDAPPRSEAERSDETPSKRWVDELLARINAGDEKAMGELIAVVRKELHDLAHAIRRKWTPQPQLRTTELIHEAFLRLHAGKELEIRDREHFFAVAARTMRWIIISCHRRKKACVDVEDIEMTSEVKDNPDLEALDLALSRLEAYSPHLALIVELKYFLGLEGAQIAEVTGRSERSVYRDWEHARAFLHRELGGDEDEELEA